MTPRGSGATGLKSRLAAALLPLLLLACGSLDRVESCRSTEIPDEEDLAGCIVDGDDRPVAGVEVVAVRKGALAKASARDSSLPDTCRALTDRLGLYRCGSLAEGTYVVTAEDEANKRSILSKLLKVEGRLVRLVTDTLRPNGELEVTVISGVDGQPMDRVECDLAGRPYIGKTNAEGRLEMSVPSGTYTLYCELGRGAASFEPVRIDGIHIKLGEVLKVPVTMHSVHESKPRPPGPITVFPTYDKVTGVVRLTWPRVPYVDNIVYVIYRVDPTLPNTIYEIHTTTDTVHTHVVYWPASERGPVDARPKHITYKINTAYANDLNALSHDAVRITVPVTPPLFLGPSVSLRLADTSRAYAVGDTARLIGTFRNAFRANKSLAWTLAGTGAELRPPRALSDSAGVDTLAYPCAQAGDFRIKFAVTDSGNVWAADFLDLKVKASP